MDAELEAYIAENSLFIGRTDYETLVKEVRVMEILVLAEDTTTLRAERFIGTEWRVVLNAKSNEQGQRRNFAYMTPSLVKEDFYNGV